MSRKRSGMVSVRFTPDEDAAIRAAAAKRGQSVSAFLRNVATREAIGPKCAHCGQFDDLAWVVVTGEDRPTLRFAYAPFSTTGPYRWAGWRCRTCCMRDYGVFALGGAA